MVEGRLWLKVILGMVLGVIMGILVGPSMGWLPAETASALGDWLALPGQIFLGLIQMIVVPLVVASVIRGLAASESIEYLRRMGLSAVVFFVATTSVAIVIGIVLALWVQPGAFVNADEARRALGGAGSLPTDAASSLPETIPRPS